MNKEQIFNFFKRISTKTLKTCWVLFKLMIPVSIIIRFIQEFDLLPMISKFFEPIMNFCGLPAETALVWITAMVVNIYGGLLSLFTLYPTFAQPLTVGQLTVLLVIILVAHTFPIELKISQKTGIRLWFVFSLRFFGAIVLGFILNKIYLCFDSMQEPAKLSMIFSQQSATWAQWAVKELKNYLGIIAVIASLITLMEILERLGVMKIITKVMSPLLRWLGISEDVLPITIVGQTLGLAYGGGLIITESQSKRIKPKDIFYSMILMGMFHSLIEDTILMIGIGGHYTGIIFFRFVMAVCITYLFVVFTKNMPLEKFCKIFITKKYKAQYDAMENLNG